MNNSNCFIDSSRACTNSCVAHIDNNKTSCRILYTLERLVPVPARPAPPEPPKVNK